jgi:hypothetical protein
MAEKAISRHLSQGAERAVEGGSFAGIASFSGSVKKS